MSTMREKEERERIAAKLAELEGNPYNVKRSSSKDSGRDRMDMLSRISSKSPNGVERGDMRDERTGIVTEKAVVDLKGMKINVRVPSRQGKRSNSGTSYTGSDERGRNERGRNERNERGRRRQVRR